MMVFDFKKIFTFWRQSKSIFDLGEVEDHGQLVYLSTGRHDGRDAQFFLYDAEGQLVVVNVVRLIQGRQVTLER